MPKTHIVGGLDAAKFAIKGDALDLAKSMIMLDATSEQDGTVATHSRIEADTSAFDLYNLKPAQGNHIDLPDAIDGLALFGNADATVDVHGVAVLAGNAGNDTFNLSGSSDGYSLILLGSGSNTVNVASGYHQTQIDADSKTLQYVNIASAPEVDLYNGNYHVAFTSDRAYLGVQDGSTAQIDIAGQGNTINSYGSISVVDEGAGTLIEVSGGSAEIDASQATGHGSFDVQNASLTLHTGVIGTDIGIYDGGDLEVFSTMGADEEYNFYSIQFTVKTAPVIHGFDEGLDHINFYAFSDFKSSGLHFSYDTLDGIESTTIKTADGRAIAIIDDAHVDKHDLLFFG